MWVDEKAEKEGKDLDRRDSMERWIGPGEVVKISHDLKAKRK